MDNPANTQFQHALANFQTNIGRGWTARALARGVHRSMALIIRQKYSRKVGDFMRKKVLIPDRTKRWNELTEFATLAV
jgi:hypothetical protein